MPLWYFRSTQSGGCSSGDFYDGSETQGSDTTITTGTVGSATPTEIAAFYCPVGVDGPAQFEQVRVSYRVSAASTPINTFASGRAYNSSCSVGNFIFGNTGELSDTGLYDETNEAVTGAWSSGDFLAIRIWGYRPSGHGNKDATIDVSSVESFVSWGLGGDFPIKPLTINQSINRASTY